MRNILMMGAWLGFALLVGAQDRLDLWPEGKTPDFQPQQIAATTQEVRTPGFKAAEHTMPHLDWFPGWILLLVIQYAGHTRGQQLLM